MPKSLLSLVLALVLSLSCVSFAFAQTNLTPLTNGDIVTMVRAKLSPALIIQRSKHQPAPLTPFRRCSRLKYKGVPDLGIAGNGRKPAR